MDPLTHDFKVGHFYNRQKDIHDRFGGSRQSGISPSAQHPVVFLFTGELGHQYGYQDSWEGPVFKYTGEGQNGDMTFTSGNKAVRDHVPDGRALLLFKQLGKSKPYQFMGEFVCETYSIVNVPDKSSQIRKGIVFHLVDTSVQDPVDVISAENLSLDELRQRAYAASEKATSASVKEGVRKFRERSAHVKAYVLKRANGICECCGMQAPFLRKDGTPYLEPHHIRQLSDSGLDRPDWVGAITPNCHREIHHGKLGEEKNERLLIAIQNKEKLK